MPYRPIVFLILALPALVHAETSMRGKPSAGLRLLSPSSYTLDVGRVQPLTVEVVVPGDDGELVVTANSNNEQLSLLNPEPRRYALTGQPLSLVYNVMPHADGRYYLMLLVELRQPGARAQQQSLGVAIEAGAVQAFRHHQKPDSTDPGVVPLPAEETIRPAEN